MQRAVARWNAVPLRARLVGIVLVLLLMVAGYALFGIIANIALLLNLVITLAVMSVLQATLTLEPGESRDVTFTLGYTENPAEHKFDPPGSGRPASRPLIVAYS